MGLPSQAPTALQVVPGGGVGRWVVRSGVGWVLGVWVECGVVVLCTTTLPDIEISEQARKCSTFPHAPLQVPESLPEQNNC